MDRLIKIATSIVFLLLFIKIIQCQMKKNLPEFYVEICSPDSKYDVTPIYDTIKTLEGVYAGLPYGSSSGRWGDSGSTWTAQHGTPSGADITYYSRYEDVFYRLNVDFPIDIIKDYMERAYARIDDENGETQEYKKLGRAHKSSSGNAYDSFSDLVFGFAPKGMVVVWLNFGITRIELGRYQAEILSDTVIIEKIKKKYLKKYGLTSERYDEAAKEYFLADASPEKWDNYRSRYHWRPVVISENSKTELIQIQTSFYNGEIECMLRPWVSDPAYKERAVPSEINVVWMTGKKGEDKKQAYLYFNWEKVNEVFKKSGSKIDLQVKISKENNIELMLNNQPFEADSIRVFDWSPSMLSGMMYKNVK
ncbi:hypothetical protein B0A81_13975 [Flavobacterium plurextorum]|uniref:DUF2931 family protein n=2 Tax=Flavobacterium plurextorum TaxID=1114867 RepID=A0ABX4CTC3_9FLAO|nr:hypothetical protein B0A81_13975 [Flavobacterium plurextorum]